LVKLCSFGVKFHDKAPKFILLDESGLTPQERSQFPPECCIFGTQLRDGLLQPGNDALIGFGFGALHGLGCPL